MPNFRRSILCILSFVLVLSSCASPRSKPETARQVANESSFDAARTFTRDVVESSRDMVNAYLARLRKNTKCESTRDCSRLIAVVAGKLVVVGVGTTAVSSAAFILAEEVARFTAARSVAAGVVEHVARAFALMVVGGAATTVSGVVILVPTAIAFTLMPGSAQAAELEDGVMADQASLERFFSAPVPTRDAILARSPRLQALYVASAYQILETLKH